MAKMLRVGELIAIGDKLNDPTLAAQKAEIEDAINEYGMMLGAKLGVECSGRGDFWDGDFMVGFAPRQDGDPVPEALEDYDTEADWVARDGGTTIAPEG